MIRGATWNRSNYLYPVTKRSFALATPASDRTLSLEPLESAASSSLTKTLIRPTSQLMREILSSEKKPSLMFLDGPKGVGKSALLSQAVKFAREHNHIVLHIPSAQDWTNGDGFFTAKSLDNMDSHIDGLAVIRFYERPFQTRRLFEDLLGAHAQVLNELPCHEDLSTPLTKQCKSLRELVQFGLDLLINIDADWINHPIEAGDVLHQLLKELARITDHTVGIVIDDYHALVGLTCMINEHKLRLHANSIRVVAQHLGRDSIENTARTLPNGYVLLASDTNAAIENWRKSRVRSTIDFPLSEDVSNDPSGRSWWKSFRHRVQQAPKQESLYIPVPELTSGELKALCATFEQGGLKREQGRAFTDRLTALAGGRADQMRKLFFGR
ncbi:unnamed protein product [Agarophyton chilense]